MEEKLRKGKERRRRLEEENGRKGEEKHTCRRKRIYSFSSLRSKKIILKRTEVIFFKLLWSPGINSKELIPPACALAGRGPYL